MEHGLIKIDEITSVIKKAPDVLSENRISKDRAEKRADELIKMKQANGMSEDLSNLMSEFIKKTKKTVGVMNEKRKPFTQTVDLLKKEFTSLENAVKSGEKTLKIISICDDWAAEKQKKIDQENEKAQAQIRKGEEATKIKEDVYLFYARVNADTILAFKKNISSILNNATIENIDKVKDEINSKPDHYSRKYFDSLKFQTEDGYKEHTKEEVDAIVATVNKDELFAAGDKEFFEEMQIHKHETIDEIPSKKKQLEEIAKEQDEEKKKKLAETEKLRIKSQTDKITQEAQASFSKEANKVKVQSSGENANAHIAANANLFSNPDINTQNIKKEYQIKVLNKAGYAQIFQFWLDRQGATLDDEKINRMTIERMIKFAEKSADEEKIVSEFLEYKQVVKSK